MNAKFTRQFTGYYRLLLEVAQVLIGIATWGTVSCLVIGAQTEMPRLNHLVGYLHVGRYLGMHVESAVIGGTTA